MPDNIDILKLRILISFLKMSPASCTVTNLARMFGVEKYTVSRAMTALFKDGLMDCSNSRNKKLTPSGMVSARKYAARMDMATNHLLYEGVPQPEAEMDAAYLSLFCSDKTFDAIREIEGRSRIRQMLRGRKNFDGVTLCRGLRDGTYQLPFMIYRETIKNGSNISMANEGFEHPGLLVVSRGIGMISLKAQDVSRNSLLSGEKMRGKISSLRYYDGNQFCDAQRNGDALSFPADVLTFSGIGQDINCILHGSVRIQMTCSVGVTHMPESSAIFTVLL